MFVADNKIDKVLEAVSLQFGIKQPKIIYYGTEIGMTQPGPIVTTRSDERSDILARQPMPPPEQRPANHPVMQHYKSIAAGRNKPLEERP